VIQAAAPLMITLLPASWEIQVMSASSLLNVSGRNPAHRRAPAPALTLLSTPLYRTARAAVNDGAR
jgi:hypothetical protein